MHELSIAQNIHEIICENISETDLERVTIVRLKIGTIAGIVSDSLEFSFQVITAETPLRNARLEIESVPFRAHCNVCDAITENDVGFAVCGECGSTKTKILSGSELNITEIEIAEQETVTS